MLLSHSLDFLKENLLELNVGGDGIVASDFAMASIPAKTDNWTRPFNNLDDFWCSCWHCSLGISWNFCSEQSLHD